MKKKKKQISVLHPRPTEWKSLRMELDIFIMLPREYNVHSHMKVIDLKSLSGKAISMSINKHLLR
jgi:hypothetical protein